MNYYTMMKDAEEAAKNSPEVLAIQAAMDAQLAEMQAKQNKIASDFAQSGQDKLASFRAMVAAKAAARAANAMVVQEEVIRPVMDDLFKTMDDQSMDLAKAMSRL